MTWVRVSPGVYRSTITGKTVNSPTTPTIPEVAPKPVAPAAAPAPAPSTPVIPKAPAPAPAAQPAPTSTPASTPTVTPPATQPAAPTTPAPTSTPPTATTAPATTSTPPAATAAPAPKPAAPVPNSNPANWVRIGPGQYRNTVTGKTVNSEQNPANAIPKAPAPAAPAAPATPAANTTPASTVNTTTTPAATTAAAKPPAVSDDDMLRFLHSKDPKSLTQRYTHDQLVAAYTKLKGGTAPAGTPPAASQPGGNDTATPTPPADTSGGAGGSTTTTTTGADTTSTPTGPDPAMVSKLMQALFPSNANLDVTASPTYQWQLNQGQKALDAKLAAMGLSDSGAALQAQNELSARVGADEATRQTQERQTQAGRLLDLLRYNQDSQQGQSNEQWDRIYQMLGLMAQQNPVPAGADAAGGLASTTTAQGTATSKIIADLFNRIVAGGGGGGVGAAPQYTPPFPSGPDTSNVDALKIKYGGQGGNDWGSLLSSVLAGFMS